MIEFDGVVSASLIRVSNNAAILVAEFEEFEIPEDEERR